MSVTVSPYCFYHSSSFSSSSLPSSRQINSQILPLPSLKSCGGLHGRRSKQFMIHGSTVRRRAYPTRTSPVSLSPWDDKPYEVLPDGEISFYDEQDVATFLDPPKTLIPLDPSSYNAAAYLWKKIDDIPEERRHRLLALLEPRLIKRAWEVAGRRYDNPKLAKKFASSLVAGEAGEKLLEFWHCCTNGGPTAVAWIKYFKKALFCCEDGKTFGRIIDESVLRGLSNSFSPLYFTVKEINEVMSTVQPCDIAYEFGDGLLDLQEYPEGFPQPAKHPPPFNDQVVMYLRSVGPGVLVGQAWREGEDLKQVPKMLCSEILMVKDYTHLNKSW